MKDKGIAVAGENNPIASNNPNITVTMHDTLGVIFLGLLSFFLFIALQLSQGRNRKLLAKLAELKQHGKVSSCSCERTSRQD